MHSFRNDYMEGAHPRILEAMLRTNLEQTAGYGEDPHTEHARELIRRAAGRDCGIYFLVGGTQVNSALIAHALRPHQAAIAASTGHISVHETGAVEASGHKVIEVDTPDGKLTAGMVENVLRVHDNHHMVQPKLVYVSQPTELGTLYSKAELCALREICSRAGLFLYVDGARLFSALACGDNDAELPDLLRLTDAFTIGGTKGGALFGEALVIGSRELRRDFLYTMKQRGGLLAKGRLLGIQFEELFRDGLYRELGEKANWMASLLRDGIAGLGYSFLTESHTNQLFPIFPAGVAEKLQEESGFEVWGEAGPGMTVARFITSWATEEEHVREFLDVLKRVS